MGGIRPLSNGLDLFRIAMVVAIAGCGAGDIRLDPGDLELRDLLGVAPDTAVAWDADQREAAQRVLDRGLAGSGAPVELTLATGESPDERVARTLVLHDAERAEAGDGALGVVRFDVTGDRAIARPIVARTPAAPQIEIWLSERWTGDLPARGLDRLGALASDAGHANGPVVIAPGPRLAVIASYVGSANGAPARLIVNPVWLAALEPVAGEPVGHGEAAAQAPAAEIVAIKRTNPTGETPRAEPTVAHAANPYSFYGSVAECAAAQRTRCESCVGTGTCEAITRGSDGDTECQTLGASDGRGYFLICINLALAITSVDTCTADAAPGCTRDSNAANELNELENNASFLDDATCGGALDGCLGEIYGAPDGEFPGLVDGGVSPPRPPRSTNVNCNESCDNDNNCEANPSCGNGPSCNNSFSCDSACSSSNDQSGCGGNCNACTEDEGDTGGSSGCGGDDSGGDGGGGCGGDGDSGGNGEGCSSDSSSSSSGCGGDSCSSDSSSSSGGGCGGDSGGGGCGGGDSGGGGCGGDSGGGGGCSGGGGGGGNSSCNASRRETSGSTAMLISIMWGVLPIPAAAWIRRRSRRRNKEVQP